MATISGDYEYINVGSSAGGGPLVVNLARHGHCVLFEAGDDQGQNLNQITPLCSEVPAARWDFFVKHHDEVQVAKNPKMTWETPDREIFIGIDPPSGSKQKGIYYPRAATLGGCTAHDASIAVLPSDETGVILPVLQTISWNPRQIPGNKQEMQTVWSPELFSCHCQCENCGWHEDVSPPYLIEISCIKNPLHRHPQRSKGHWC